MYIAQIPCEELSAQLGKYELSVSSEAASSFQSACFAAKGGWCSAVDTSTEWQAADSAGLLEGTFGYCIAPACCTTERCDLDGGTAAPIQHTLLEMVLHNCGAANSSGPWCPVVDSTISVSVSTPCTGAPNNLLWWTMMTVGLALFSCFCLAVLVRFGYHRCTSRGRTTRRADRLANLLEQMLLEQAGGAAQATQEAEEEHARLTLLRVEQASAQQRPFKPSDGGADDSCTVCLEPLSQPGPPSSTAPALPVASQDAQSNATVIEFPECGHVFHAPCLLEWLQLKPSCPICRTEWPLHNPAAEEV